jgi:hypothetical protein
MKFWEQQEKERIEQLIEERKQAVQTRERLSRIVQEKQNFIAKLQSERKAEYKVKITYVYAYQCIPKICTVLYVVIIAPQRYN